MRPVMLRMEGFAAFREPTVVDFRDADYFVLVGPTGSGKSTVIDAMTFALYGSVPRWDDRRTVALALAPGTLRGAVSLVFDVGGSRYVAARELRRARSGSVTVREARLERLADPAGVADPAEETAPLAETAPGVTDAVTALLGLPFDDFCTCVVLPQGDFADFLHAAPNKRQEKLERILGLGVYDRVMRRANAEAATQSQRADWLGEQLAGYTDATAEAEAAARRHAAALGDLERRVAETVPTLAAAGAAMTAAEVDTQRLGAERDRLAGLAAPPGLAALDARRRAATGALTAATDAARTAELADTAARDLVRAAPRRGPLEQALHEHAELAALDAARPGLVIAHDDAGTAAGAAAREADTARAAVETARAGRDAAATDLAAASATVATVTAERDALRGVAAAPAGLERLEGRLADAVAARDTASDRASATEDDETRARDAVVAAPARGPLEQARRDHAALAAARAEHAAATGRRADADTAATAARERAEAARGPRDEARERLDRARRTDLAAVLRPTLVAGAHCPVCAQAVRTPPAPLPTADLDAAAEALATAEDAHDRARQAAVTATAAATGAATEQERAAAAVTRGEEAVHEVPDPDAVEATLAALDRSVAAAETAAGAARAARRGRDDAVAALDVARADSATAARALRAARDPLVALGAPAPGPGPGSGSGSEGDDVARAWRTLLAWAAAEAATREEALPAATDGRAGAARAHDAAAGSLAAAERGAAAARTRETAAARAEEAARGVLDGARRRAGELRDALADAPTSADASAALDRLAALERDARTTEDVLRDARHALRAAEGEAAAVAGEVEDSWWALRAARDPLVVLGAPTVHGDLGDLGDAWTALTAWAGREADARDRALAASGDALARARTDRDDVARRLTADLAEHGVDPAPGTLPDDLARAAPVAVVAALGRARAAAERVAERRAEAVDLTARRERAQADGQVAKLLGEQLRSDRFPRWLVASALDALVVDASRTLAELSGGQFALTHDRGEFLVVDHADADAARPVKTLSGGETFQASLALALALSSQLVALAARGAATLESIVLDEGFGTLDDANLDVVASTLENLAATGDRTVGVITHVPALAERVPTRFVVHRDARGAAIVREGT